MKVNRRAWLAVIVAAALAGCGGLPGQVMQAPTQARLACPRQVFYYDLAWSPDGASIYFEMTAASGISTDIYVMDSSGKNPRMVTANGFMPRPSPDGRWLLYYDMRDTELVYALLNLSTGQTREMQPRASLPSWSPDSRWLLYEVAGQEGINLVKTDVQTDQTVALTSGSDPNGSEAWSPDGKSIIFQSDQSGQESGMYRMDAEGSHVTRIVTARPSTCPLPAEYSEFLPDVWLPDGKTIGAWYECDGTLMLHTITPSGDEVTNLSSLSSYLSAVQWSPDGRMLLFMSMDSTYIAVTNADGTHVRVLRKGGYSQVWSPDGSRVAFVGKDSAGMDEIYTIRPDSTDLTQLTQNPNANRVCPH